MKNASGIIQDIDMKTNVIQLEVHDDVISIKDKMAWQSCQRMILVWPKRGKILHNELELVLLNRAAKSLGAELALVTHHPVVSEWALDSNLPLFGSISAAEKSAWKTDLQGTIAHKVPKGVQAIKAVKEKLPLSSSPIPASPIVRKLAVLISLAALIALLVVAVPQAEVTYYPVPTLQEVEISIKASEVFSGINPSGNIPEKPIFVEVNGEKSIPSSGKVSIPTTKAVGRVVFSNLTKSSVTLPVGTLLLAGDETLVSFTLTEDVVVPAGIGNSGEGQVEALVAGTDWKSGSRIDLDLIRWYGFFGECEQPDAFDGGGALEAPSPNEEDYAELERQLLVDLMAQGLASLKADQAEGVGLIEPSLTLDQILLSEKVNPIGEPADEAVLRMNLKLKIYAYQQSDLRAIATLVLNSNKPNGLKPQNEKISINRVGDFHVDDFGQSVWTVNASRNLVPDWDVEKTATDLSGENVADAQIILSKLFDQSSPAVFKMWIPRWPWMPFLSTNIHFVDGATS